MLAPLPQKEAARASRSREPECSERDSMRHPLLSAGPDWVAMDGAARRTCDVALSCRLSTLPFRPPLLRERGGALMRIKGMPNNIH